MDTLNTTHIGIVGLGLMGGSLAMALRGQCAALFGVDHDPQVVTLALERGIVDDAETHLEKLLTRVDVLVLATPLSAIVQILGLLPPLERQGVLVLDLGSTKRRVVQAMQALPSSYEPVGGHPMCGKERGSLLNAEATLYRGATFALTPLERTSQKARRLAEALVSAVGARPFWVDATTHDRWVAVTSHLPYLLANTLAGNTPLEVQPLIGPGWRSTARLAPTPWAIVKDILATNREAILGEVAAFRQAWQHLEEVLHTGSEVELQALLEKGAENYMLIVESIAQREEER